MKRTISEKKAKHYSAAEKWKDRLLRLIYPQRCVLCDEIIPCSPVSVLKKHELRAAPAGCCAGCRSRLPYITGAACFKCGKQLISEQEEYCWDCRHYKHYFDQGIAAFVYYGKLRRSVYRMKFENRRDYLDFYAEEMTASLRKVIKKWNPAVIIPVPMHPSGKKKRGFNQSELLAQKISGMTGIPFEKNGVACVRKKGEQKSLDRMQRIKNIRGCFQLAGYSFSGKRVLVVDDVYTTGSTMDEMSRVLFRGGAKAVYFVVLSAGIDKKDGMHKGKNMI